MGSHTEYLVTDGEKKLAGQSVRSGREPLPAWNEGAAGHAGKTLIEKK